MDNNTNPLSKFFRQPAVYVKIPSGGKFYPNGSLDLPVNGELPIYPMSALDEIISRTPDALFNGSAMIQIFSSCVPNIKSPWDIPQIDVDLLLTAIKIASYGHNMELSTTCIHCANEQEYMLDLRQMIDQFRSPDYDTSLDIGDLKIYFKPLSYKQVNESAMIQFKKQKEFQLLSRSEHSDEEKFKLLNEMMLDITKLTFSAVSQCIAAVKTTDGVVDNAEQIEEFVHNIDRLVYERIKSHVMKIKEGTDIAPLKINCDNCKKDYTQPFTLDMSNFFVAAS